MSSQPSSESESLDRASPKTKETESEFERNHNRITCDNSYQSPILKKDVLIINNYVYYESNEHVDTINDSSKYVDARKYPINFHAR